jgi:hypothetical protein
MEREKIDLSPSSIADYDPGMVERPVAPAAVLGLLLALGGALGGLFIGWGLFRARASDRFVTVKGLAEREVPANLALWPLVFTATAEDLESLQRALDASTAKVVAFLEQRFPGDEVTVSAPRITDREAQGMRMEGRPLERYVAEVTVTLRSGKIAEVRGAQTGTGELVKQGVPLIRSYEYNTQYLFTDLDRIKPEMIEEATRDARRAAEQFARDSGSEVGAIRRAQQGYFSIEDRDSFSPEVKKVRVVTTVEYFFRD